jgi:2-succinyl-6-hydroxy-2,4-cyclohexadiene-1-carboxylate synthase
MNQPNKLHIEISGHGHGVLALHGFAQTNALWEPFRDTWSTQASLILLDIPGHGNTTWSEHLNEYQIEFIAKEIVAQLTQKGFSSIDIVGYSMGGRLAIALAVRYPHFIRKAVFVSTTPGIEEEAERRARINQDAKWIQLLDNNSIDVFAERWSQNSIFEGQSLTSVQQERLLQMRLSQNPIGLKRSLQGMGTGVQPSYWDKLDALPKETLWLTGSKDIKFTNIAKRVKEEVPGVEWHQFEDCGHSIPMEREEIFGKMVMEFIHR